MATQTMARPRTAAQEPEWAVWLTVAVALILGWLVMTMALGRSESGTVNNSTISYPAGWVQTQEPGADFAAADTSDGGPYGMRVALRSMPTTDLVKTQLITQTVALDDAATAWSLKRGKGLNGYRALSINTGPVTTDANGNTTHGDLLINGRKAAQVESAYLMEAGTNIVPGLMHAVDTIVLSTDQKSYYILSLIGEESQFDSQAATRDRILASWHVP